MGALVYADRVKETTSTTGTGTVTLAGAASGYRAFSAIGDGCRCYYRLESGTDWEIGIGTYTLSGTTLSRDVVLASTNSGSKITLAGTSTVYHDIPATFFSGQIRIVKARVAATANVTLATDLENGDTLNGVTLATGDTVFTPEQSTTHEKRLWVVKASGAPDPHPLMPIGDVISGFLVTVEEGTARKDRIWLQTANTATVGTNALTWTVINEASADQVANTIYSGPASGSDAAPTFRALVPADSPSGIQADRKNKLINPMFRTWGHSATSPVTITDGAYSGPTGWFFLTQNTSVEISAGSGLSNSSHSVILTNQHASARSGGTSQFVEQYDTYPLRGKTVTFSIKAKCSNAKNVRAALINWTGTANAPTKDIVNDWTSTTYTEGNFFISSGSLDIIAVSSAVSVGTSATEVSVSGSVGASTNNLQVFVWTEDALSEDQTVEFSEAMLVKGSHTVEFDAPYYPQEIFECDYRCRLHASDASQTDAEFGWGHAQATNALVFHVPLGHPMRAVPSISFTASDWQVMDSVGSRQNVTNLTISSTISSRRILFMTATVASGLTVGRGGAVVADSTSGRVIIFDSEIGV